MKRFIIMLVLLAMGAGTIFGQNLVLSKDAELGWKAEIDGELYPINGMVWAHTPIGENPSYVLWDKSDEFIKTTLDIDFSMMKAIGVNVVRSFDIIPPKWVEYVYDTYGISVAMNTLFGRYGVNVDGKWYPRTEYNMPETREFILEETRAFVEKYKDVRGVSMFLLGNENNYGLEWTTNEIENLPEGEIHVTKARYLYTLFGEAVDMINDMTDKPVGIVNGDIQYLELIAEYVPNMDFFASNVYRGRRAYDPTNEYSTPFFSAIAEQLDKPVMLTEMGADAYNTITETEAQYEQALFVKSQWEELYEESYGKGKSQNTLGGFVFEWIDEWWKKGFDKNLSIHDTEGTWVNGGYYYDFIPEKWNSHNNMNEEWFGINAQSESYYSGYDVKINKRIPRAAYYMLGDIWETNLFEVPAEEVEPYFEKIVIANSLARANADRTGGESSGSGLSSDMFTFTPSIAGGARIHSDELIGDADDRPLSYEQTINLKGTLTPSKDFGAQFDVRVQYGALENNFEQFNYSYALATRNGSDTTDKYRLAAQLYGTSFLYKKSTFEVEGFYHDGYVLDGHTDWVAQGDKFGFMQETFYAPEVDKDLSQAPFGIELRTKGKYLGGATIFAAPEAYRGARPSLFGNYYRTFYFGGLGLSVGAVHQEEITKDVVTTGDLSVSNPYAYNDPLGRKSSAYLGASIPLDGVVLMPEFSGLLSGAEWIGTEYRTGVSKTSGTTFKYDTADVELLDALGGKAKLSAIINLPSLPVVEVFGQYSYQGIVAEGGGIKNRKGSHIVENGAEGKQEITGGASVFLGNLNVMLNGLWRAPLLKPLEKEINGTTYYRNTVDQDYVYVGLDNRELLQFEILGTYDLTGSTYFHNFDNDDREDAKLATSLGLLYTVYQGETDQLNFVAADGVTRYSYEGGGLDKVRGLYQLNARVVSNFATSQRILLTGNIGTAQNTGAPSTGSFVSATETPENLFVQTYDLIAGNDTNFKLQESYGGTVTYVYKQLQLDGSVQRWAWGQEEWHIEYGYKVPWEYGIRMAYHFDKVSLLNPSRFVYVDLKARNYTELVNTAREGDAEDASAIAALNPLGGNSEGNYDYNRFQVTVGYQINF